MKTRRYPLPNSKTTAEAVILANGEYPSGLAAEILRAAPYVVCCDGAADNYILHGGVPSAIIGDGDSLSEITGMCYPDIIVRSDDQESNDLTKAFNFCMDRGLRQIIIVGATGGREDHTLANISLLADYCKRADVQMITATGVFNAIGESSRFGSLRGQQVSIFTIGTTTRIEVEHLAYIPPADGLCSWWRGSLNEATGNRFTIHTYGPTLVFRSLEGK